MNATTTTARKPILWAMTADELRMFPPFGRQGWEEVPVWKDNKTTGEQMTDYDGVPVWRAYSFMHMGYRAEPTPIQVFYASKDKPRPLGFSAPRPGVAA